MSHVFRLTMAEKRSLWSQPCRICSDSGDIEIDHIVPTTRGGSNDRSNAQPLCRCCNAIKGNRRTNDEVAQWIRENPREYQRRRERRRDHVALKRKGFF